VIHSRDPRTILAYGAAVRVLRVAVNAPGSTGSAGLDTHLAPSMTIGTGFFGRSALTENLQPSHLMQWTRIAYASDPGEPFGDFAGLEPWSARPAAAPVASATPPAHDGVSREELRRLILDELRELVGR
jgi:acetaldehyde dehydrogenase/alcohol dehydrogenase